MKESKMLAVAMSGGVDSSVAAAVLAESGRSIIGVFLRLPRFGSAADAAAADAEESAARAASALGITLHAFDCDAPFDREIVESFCASYLDGLTPNPCVDCNRIIKFGWLLEKARELGASSLATGHYARISRDEETGRYLLRQGLDDEKDQSYFLYSLSQSQLARAIFPLGEMTKSQVRERAALLGLTAHDRPESSDICFLSGGDYREFIKLRFPELREAGPVLDAEGRLLGRHRGVAFHTIGQRKGLGIGGGKPLYVLKIDAKARALVVGDRDELLKEKITVRHLNWIVEPTWPLEAEVRTRYRQQARLVVIKPLDDARAEALFEKPQQAVAPGQSAVFYKGDLVLGGGIIE